MGKNPWPGHSLDLHPIAAQDERPAEEIFFEQKAVHLKRLYWPNFVAITAAHIGAIFALFYFSWAGFFCFLGLYIFTGCFGITLGYHRMLSHRSFRLNPVVGFFSHLAGCLSMQGQPCSWAMNHRVHHARSDKTGDPHSPLLGFWWSHMNWLMVPRDESLRKRLYDKYIPDLYRDPLCMFFERTYHLWNILLGVVLLYFGGVSCLLWGLFFRVAFVYHLTWAINSATHIWGYRNYTTTDCSRNLWWVALGTFGEGWHNNHHAQPWSAYHGHRWWEVDFTGWVVYVLGKLRLATEIRLPGFHRHAAGKSSVG